MNIFVSTRSDGNEMQKDWREAIVVGDLSLAESLIAAEGNVDSRDRFGQTAVMLAATAGHKSIVDLLIKQGADLDVTGKFGLSGVMLAIINGHIDIATALVEAGANTEISGSGAPGFSGKTANELASERGYEELSEAILRRQSR